VNMTRILAISDTHLKGDLPEKLASLAKDADLVLHAGDFVTIEVYEAFDRLGNFEAVSGNSDSVELRKLLPERKVIEVEGVRLGLVHRATRSSDLAAVEFLAREMEVDALIFGHIHRPYVERVPQLLICPGSPTEPRMSPPTVAEIEVNYGEIKGRILPLGKPICKYIKYAESLSRQKTSDYRREPIR